MAFDCRIVPPPLGNVEALLDRLGAQRKTQALAARLIDEFERLCRAPPPASDAADRLVDGREVHIVTRPIWELAPTDAAFAVVSLLIDRPTRRIDILGVWLSDTSKALDRATAAAGGAIEAWRKASQPDGNGAKG
jgi:hypothetical protein